MMRIGIVGGGQLGRMLALAAYPLGLRVTVLDHAQDAPAGVLAPLVVGGFDDHSALDRLAEASEVITFDFENVPAESAEYLGKRLPMRPSAVSLRAAQDRVTEKTLFRSLDIPTVQFAAVDDADSLRAGIDVTGLPAVLKTRRLGYDGKGQRRVMTAVEAESARLELGGNDLILESLVAFRREVSVIAVRGAAGEFRAWPLVENVHRHGILHTSLAPAPDTQHATAALGHIQRLMEQLDHVGVLALELFDCEEGFLANEFAPRVHNSGHWTIEGAVTSQFENHIRAICGLPLGGTDAVGHAGMVNFIGKLPPPGEVLALPGVHFHDYGKEHRPGRKVGHATVVTQDATMMMSMLEKLTAIAEQD